MSKELSYLVGILTGFIIFACLADQWGELLRVFLLFAGWCALVLASAVVGIVITISGLIAYCEIKDWWDKRDSS